MHDPTAPQQPDVDRGALFPLGAGRACAGAPRPARLPERIIANLDLLGVVRVTPANRSLAVQYLRVFDMLQHVEVGEPYTSLLHG